MKPTAQLIDFARYRTRKLAQQRARAMWDMYALQATGHAFSWTPTTLVRTHHA